MVGGRPFGRTMKRNRTHQAHVSPRVIKKESKSALADLLPMHRAHEPGTPDRIVEAMFIGNARRASVTEVGEQPGRLRADTWFHHVNAIDPDEAVSWTRASIEGVLARAREFGVLPQEAAVAFDMHVDPDYTETHTGCIGYHDLPGTDYGMAYLSAECLDPKARLTLAVTPVTPFTNREKALRDQLASVTRWLALALALADRAFFTVYALRMFLECARQFIVPAICNRRVQSHKEVAWRERRRIPDSPHSFFVVPEYVMGSGTSTVTVQLVFFFEPNKEDPTRDDCFAFATNPGPLAAAEVVILAARYRERWGIESGYRCKDRLRMRTTSDHYAARLFLQLSSIATYNLWTLLRALHAHALTPIKPGRRKDRYLARYFRDDIDEAFAT